MLTNNQILHLKRLDYKNKDYNLLAKETGYNPSDIIDFLTKEGLYTSDDIRPLND